MTVEGELERSASRSRGLVVTAAVAILVALGALPGCDFGGDGEDDEAQAPARGKPTRLDVLVFNIEYSGGPETDRVIRRLDADVVGVLESYARLPEIARRTGYRYYNTSLQILSKYPILEPSEGNGSYSFIEVEPGYAVAFCNVHLDYVKWGPRMLANGVPLEQVLATEERVRLSSMERPIEAMTQPVDEGYPVILTGDFNEPSGLDYTEEAIRTRKGISEPVPWPVSEELLELGFRDTYREIHPDPVKTPGITHRRTEERIDYVYAAGDSTTLDSRLIGEPGGEDVEREFEPWTSDHRAVLSTLELAPAALPALVAVDERLRTVGDEVEVSWNVPGGGAAAEIRVVAADEGEEPLATLEATGERGAEPLDTTGWEPGTYEAGLVDGDGDEIARVSFQLRDPEAKLELRTSKDTYAPGEPIEVSWTNGPANRWDWLGIYKASAADPETDDFPVWTYVDGHDAGTVPPSISGEAVLSRESQGTTWPLPPGDYVVHYLLADQYDSAGSAKFTVREGD